MSRSIYSQFPHKRIVIKPLLLFAFFVHGQVFSQKGQKTAVYFAFGKSELSFNARQALDSALKNNSSIDSIKIFAYCDSVDDFALNDTLSMRRAFVVRDYLLQKGVSAGVLTEVKWYGKRNPANDNNTARGRVLNRRADVLIFERPARVKVVATLPPDTSIKKGILSSPWDSVVEKMKVGESFILQNLNFYPGQHVLLPSAWKTLDTLKAVLESHPNMKIEIQGFVCCTPSGEDGYDLYTHEGTLSVNRAKFVYQYLISKGIPGERLSYHGYGNQPLVLEITDADREYNRRVQIKILEK